MNENGKVEMNLADSWSIDARVTGGDMRRYHRPSPLNRSVCRELILATLAETRPALAGKLTRVSESSLDYLERRVRNIIAAELEAHPTVGATIRLGAVR